LANVTSKRKESPDAKFYKSARWKSVRLLKIAENPICEPCYHAGKMTDATFGSPIDHAVRLEDGGAALDLANLITIEKEKLFNRIAELRSTKKVK